MKMILLKFSEAVLNEKDNLFYKLEVNDIFSDVGTPPDDEKDEKP